MENRPALKPTTEFVPDLKLLKLEENALDFFNAMISHDDAVVKERIIEVQKEAYTRYPFPCIRMFHHVRLMMSEHPDYADVLAAGKYGDTRLIDVGCCMGTDVRKAAFDGYPEGNIIGTDLSRSFLALGHKLYDDADTCKIRFIQADIFAMPIQFEPSSETPLPLVNVSELSQLRGTITHIYTGALFHLFDESRQYELALRLVSMLKREKGAIIFGRHEGLEHAGKIQDPPAWKTNRWGHSPASWTALWQKVFEEVEDIEFAETQIETLAYLSDGFGSLDEANLRSKRPMLVWSVRSI